MLLTAWTKAKKQKSVSEQIWCCGPLPWDCIRLHRCCRWAVISLSLSFSKQVNSVKLQWWNGSWQMCVPKVEWQQWSKRERTGLGPIRITVTEKKGWQSQYVTVGREVNGFGLSCKSHTISRHFCEKSFRDFTFFVFPFYSSVLPIFFPNPKSNLP